jgi:hypothetical protein
MPCFSPLRLGGRALNRLQYVCRSDVLIDGHAAFVQLEK